jgi:hypothetical protein
MNDGSVDRGVENVSHERFLRFFLCDQPNQTPCSSPTDAKATAASSPSLPESSLPRGNINDNLLVFMFYGLCSKSLSTFHMDMKSQLPKSRYAAVVWMQVASRKQRDRHECSSHAVFTKPYSPA